ncbi:hypothetical protein DL95DRAFT_407002 [Leptodontidium sp. 2 PMI_412]|nr:hypothetical protein DL95DRAFT_407002 [Leptodontidium sp. 2 PMI_412]
MPVVAFVRIMTPSALISSHLVYACGYYPTISQHDPYTTCDELEVYLSIYQKEKRARPKHHVNISVKVQYTQVEIQPLLYPRAAPHQKGSMFPCGGGTSARLGICICICICRKRHRWRGQVGLGWDGLARIEIDIEGNTILNAG